MGRWVVPVVAVLIAAGVPDRVSAEESALEEQVRLGAQLASEEKFSDAIDVWDGVMGELSGDLLERVLGYMALAHKQAGNYPEALHYMLRYGATVRGKADGRLDGWVKELVGELEAAYSRVELVADVGSVEYIFPWSGGGKRETRVEAKDGRLVWWFKPGAVACRASAAGHGEVEVIVEVGKRPATEPPLRLAVVFRGLGGGLRGGQESGRVLEWVFIGSGLGMVALGGLLHGLAYSENEDLKRKYSDVNRFPCGLEAKKLYDKEYDDSVWLSSIMAYSLYGVGALAVLTGLVLWDSGEGPGEGALSFEPLLVPGGAGASMELGW